MWPQSSLLDSSSSDYFWEVHVKNPTSYQKGTATGGDGSATSIGSSASGTIKSPMPGKISRINCNVGDIVNEGDVLLVMEAMKMEHIIKSPISGTVSELRCNALDVVKDGKVLVTVEAAGTTTDTETTNSTKNGSDNNNNEEVA